LLDARLCKLSLVLLPAFMHTHEEFSVNWYQRNYPYAWAGARLVRDL